MIILATVICVILIIFVYFLLCAIKHSEGTAVKAPDVLLILGCRVRGEKAEETLQMRINAAAQYLKENPQVIAIPCGGIVHEDQFKSEAAVIAEQLIEKGIDPQRIIPEDKSKTTVQNFVNAKAIIDGLNRENTQEIAFLSSEFHLYRAGKIAKKHGFNMKTVAAPSPEKLKVKNYLREAVILMFFDFAK